MEIINTPAKTDYLFVSINRPLPTDNRQIRVQVRQAGTYMAYDYWHKPENLDHNIDTVLDHYGYGGYSFNKVARAINELIDKTGLPVRFSCSMLRYKDALLTAFNSCDEGEEKRWRNLPGC